MAQVRAPFPCVIAKEVSPIVDHLELVLFLVQRTITAVHAQGVANIEPTRAIDVEKWNSRCRLVHIQAGNARIGRGRRAETARLHVHAVPEKPKPDVGQPLRAQCVVESG